MASSSFDIYQSDRGYLTVSNEVQRLVLAAVLDKERSFQDLVAATKRSKPTVSQQIKELVAKQLLEEQLDPLDGRRRLYRLKGQRIGSSDLPVPVLRDAVKDYVKRSSEPMLRLPLVIEGLVATGPSPKVSWGQAAFLGRELAPQMELDLEGGPWMRMSRYLDRAGLAKTLRIDLEKGQLECEVVAGLRGPPSVLVAAVAGLVSGAWEARTGKGVKHVAQGRRLTLSEQ